MKNVFLLLLVSLFAIVSCSKFEEKEDVYSIEGKWAYESREDKVWEVVKFLPNGVFYFSNQREDLNIENENQDGRYSIVGNHIVGTYKLNGTLMNLDATIIEITDYELTLKSNDTGLYVTYHKVIDEISVDCDERYTPNYSQLLNHKITGYFAHNPLMVNVNSQTGEITGELYGITMIDVITEKGIAVVIVSVKGIKDYTQYFGKTKADVDKEYSPEYGTKNDDIFYINGALVRYIGFSYNEKGEVYVVQVIVQDDASMSDMEIKEYLEGKYYLYEKGCEENYWTYMDSPNRSTATAGIVWNTRIEENEGMKIITYLKLD